MILMGSFVIVVPSYSLFFRFDGFTRTRLPSRPSSFTTYRPLAMSHPPSSTALSLQPKSTAMPLMSSRPSPTTATRWPRRGQCC